MSTAVDPSSVIGVLPRVEAARLLGWGVHKVRWYQADHDLECCLHWSRRWRMAVLLGWMADLDEPATVMDAICATGLTPRMCRRDIRWLVEHGWVECLGRDFDRARAPSLYVAAPVDPATGLPCPVLDGAA